MKIKLSYDSRDYHSYQHFGQGADLNTPQDFDDPSIPAKLQPLGNVECTCYTAEYIAQNKTKKEYDIDELFSRVPHTSSGADPRDVFTEVIKNGLKVKATGLYEKPFTSYFRADTGYMDAFDNVRSAMLSVQSPIAIGTYWYSEWSGLAPGAIMPIGKTPVSGHMYANEGWKFGNITAANVNGEPMFIIEWWGGYTLLMPRATFNQAMAPWGMSAWVLSDAETDAKRKKYIVEKLKDAIINLIIKLKQEIMSMKNNAQPSPVPPETERIPNVPNKPVDRLTQLCEAIRDYEGAPGDRNYRNNNPGNCRYSPVGYLPIYEPVKKDSGGFAIFKDYETGFLYLKNLVKSKVAKNPNQTLFQFMSVYAPTGDGNNPVAYAGYLARALGVTVDTPMKLLV